MVASAPSVEVRPVPQVEETRTTWPLQGSDCPGRLPKDTICPVRSPQGTVRPARPSQGTVCPAKLAVRRLSEAGLDIPKDMDAIIGTRTLAKDATVEGSKDVMADKWCVFDNKNQMDLLAGCNESEVVPMGEACREVGRCGGGAAEADLRGSSTTEDIHQGGAYRRRVEEELAKFFLKFQAELGYDLYNEAKENETDQSL
jgi:hypothetical protein